MSDCERCGNNHDLMSKEWTLAGFLCVFRTDRPDEWRMDDFMRMSLKLEQENKRLRDALKNIKHITLKSDEFTFKDAINDCYLISRQALEETK